MEISTVYNPKETENKWYDFWLQKNYFQASVNPEKKPYTIVIPPPNITGILTMGHVLNNTIQDILIRWKRMQGYEACWIPGTDHAGIATQNVVEKSLAKQKIFKRDIGREKFIEHVWKWKEQYGSIIIRQLKRLGCSCDWERERFTLDEGLSNAVKEVFVRLYDKGLIYRGKYIVNWCTRCNTALSDDEVDHAENEGSLWYIKYPLKDDTSKFAIVATTRPETMLGDTAVAVNPNDERYKGFIGKTLILPLANREIKVVADEFVDPQFGTGMVKVTPAHDPNDFQIGLRHNLEKIIIFTSTGKMNENVPEEYIGLDRFECRKKVIAALEELVLLVKTEKHTNAIARCYRCDSIIEPYLSDQWFVKMKPLAEKALEVVVNGKVQIYPEKWVKTYQHWMENIKDWCISRQLWWGHRIPVYYCDNKDCPPIVARAKPQECPKCSGTKIEQDSDVLDTWFSSWLWPFSTLDWPKENKELKYFYPTNTLVTAPDIIFFWVARMIMAGIEFMGEIPFEKVYFNSLVRDMQGRKMSKSLGNSPDPLDIMEEFSADALRFTVTYLTPLGQDVLFAKEKCEIGRNFCNKIWNASRFIQMNLDTGSIKPLSSIENELEAMDKWILSEYNNTIKRTTQALEEFNFTEAAHALYDFFWSQFCDWYLEFVKPRTKADVENTKKYIPQSVLINILTGYIKLLHPIMPHITEELYQNMKNSELKSKIDFEEAVIISKWPEFSDKQDYRDAKIEIDFLIDVIKNVRVLKKDMNVPVKNMITLTINAPGREFERIFEKYLPNLRLMIKVEKISFSRIKPAQSASVVVGNTEIYLHLEGIIDFEKEKARIKKEYDEVSKYLETLQARLANLDFIAKAPVKEVDKLKNLSSETNEKLIKLKKSIDAFGEKQC